MKFRTSRYLLLIGAISFPLAGSQAAQAKPKTAPKSRPARLIVQRAPNFGTNLVVRLSIDGKKVADIPRNHHYGDFISAGHRSLSVLSLPNTERRKAASIRLKVKSGQLYIYTVAWDSDRLILRRSTYYSPSVRVSTEGGRKK